MATAVAGTQATQAIAVAQLHVGEVVPNSNWCANFVSQVYKEAGLSSFFSATGSVPTLVGEFTGKTSKNITSAQPGDLIVFGDNEHVMLYEGSGKVIGTATDTSTNISRVIETDWNNVYTNSGAKGPSLVIHTNLDNSDPTIKHTLANFISISDSADFGSPTAAANNYFQGIAKWLNPNAPDVVNYQDALNANYGQYPPYWSTEQLDFLKQVDSTTPINQITVPDTIANDMQATLKTSGFQNLWGGQDPTQGQGFNSPIGDLTGAAGLIGNATDVLGKLTNASNWLHLGAMLVGVGLIGFGMVVIARDLGETGPQGLVSPMPIILKEGS
jgi:hypothetical protein